MCRNDIKCEYMFRFPLKKFITERVKLQSPVGELFAPFQFSIIGAVDTDTWRRQHSYSIWQRKNKLYRSYIYIWKWKINYIAITYVWHLTLLKICTQFWNALFCFVYIITLVIFIWPIYFGYIYLTYLPISFGMLPWHWGNHMIAPVPVKQPWRIWVNYNWPPSNHNKIQQSVNHMHNSWDLLTIISINDGSVSSEGQKGKMSNGIINRIWWQ